MLAEKLRCDAEMWSIQRHGSGAKPPKNRAVRRSERNISEEAFVMMGGFISP